MGEINTLYTMLKKVKCHPKPVPFKIYAIIDSNLESVIVRKGSTQKNIKITFLVFLVVFICNTVQINHFCSV